MKIWYVLGCLYLIFCLYFLLADTLERIAPDLPPQVSRVLLNNGWSPHMDGGRGGAISPSAWFNEVKPYCNSVEVETRLSSFPPPPGLNGTSYAAACYALAGKIEKARTSINSLSLADRSTAAGIVFNIGHPVADMGDDKSAGPIMRLVVEYQPDNYMALYHAGMSEYILGEYGPAQEHLTKFLEIYTANDGWRSNAINVLQKLSFGEGAQ